MKYRKCTHYRHVVSPERQPERRGGGLWGGGGGRGVRGGGVEGGVKSQNTTVNV